MNWCMVGWKNGLMLVSCANKAIIDRRYLPSPCISMKLLNVTLWIEKTSAMS